MIVYHNNEQEKQYNELLEKHKGIIKRDLCIDDLIKNLRIKLEGNKKIKIVYDGFLGPLRRIQRIYNQYKINGYDDFSKIKIDDPQTYEMCRKNDEREIYMSSFFHNAKYFCEITNDISFKIKIHNPELYENINTLRNMFAHAYDKKFLDSKYFVKIEENHSHENGLFKLKLISLNNEKQIVNIYFSFELFMYELKEYLQNLILKL